MKQLLLSILMMLLPLLANADAVEIKGIYYNLSTETNTAEVTYAPDYYSGDIVIPETVNYEGMSYSVTSIGEYAFFRCSDLTSITIPNSVTSIGYYAFYGCSSLTSITIPDGVTFISKSVFSNCENLVAIIVENGNPIYDSRNNCNAIIRTADNELIAGCKTTVIPNSVTSIGIEAFSFCSLLTSIIIPSSVTSIADYAFDSCSSLTSISIPNSVTTIGEYAFQYCSGLTSVIVGNSVTSIGEYAFKNCSSLTSISIPKSVTSIGRYAFSGCSGLTSVTIPESVISIGDRAFEGTAWYESQPDGLVYAGKVAYQYKGTMPDNTSITLKEGTLVVADGAFRGCSSLTSIEIPNSVTSIGYAAFRECIGLTSITIPNSITTIGKHAFYDCSSLTDVSLSEGLISIGEEAFHTCAISTISLPQSLIRIGEQAFEQCRQLTSITLPKNVAYLGNADYIDSYGEMQEEDDLYGDVFNGCDLLADVKVDELNQAYTSVEGLLMTKDMKTLLYIPGAKTEVVVPEGTETIHSGASSSDNLTTITLPKSLRSIEEGGFEYSNGVTSITSKMEVPATLGNHNFSYKVYNNATLYVPIGTKSKYEATDGWKDFKNIVEMGSNSPIDFADATVKAICVEHWDTNGDGMLSYEEAAAVTDLGSAFSNNKEITSFDELQYFTGLTSIGGWVFYGCKGLVSITIPNSVTSIGEGAFSYCSGLASIFIPNSVKSIGGYAFDGCSNIKTIKVENGNTIYDSRNDCNAIIRTADNELIVGCSNTVIPNSVTSIGNGAFEGCSLLTSIIIPNSVTSIGSSAFEDCSSLTSITIPDGVTTIGSYAFRECSGLTSLTFPNSLTTIGHHAFYGDSVLTSLIIPNSVTTIKECAFSGCSGLTSLTISNNLTSIENGVFSDCRNLTSVTIPNSVISIKSSAFAFCSGLISITIPNSVTSIGWEAFKECSSLASVTIPNSVTSIDYHAFYHCSSLTSVTSLIEEPFAIDNYMFENYDNATLYVPVGTKSKYEATDGWKNFKNIVEMDLLPVDNGQTIDFGTDIDENTNLNGNIMDNVFVNVNNGDGSYDPSEGCIIVSKPTDDSAIDGKEIFGEDFKDNYTGIVFKLALGEGTIKVEAQTTGNMVLKVKIGDGMPITMELEGKLKVSFPYNVSEDTYVYIYGGLNTSNNAKGMRRVESADGTLKIYGIEVDSNANDIESLEVSQDDIATIYNLNGHRINSLQRGVNIIRMNDGKVRKVVVK